MLNESKFKESPRKMKSSPNLNLQILLHPPSHPFNPLIAAKIPRPLMSLRFKLVSGCRKEVNMAVRRWVFIA